MAHCHVEQDHSPDAIKSTAEHQIFRDAIGSEVFRQLIIIAVPPRIRGSMFVGFNSKTHPALFHTIPIGICGFE